MHTKAISSPSNLDTQICLNYEKLSARCACSLFAAVLSKWSGRLTLRVQWLCIACDAFNLKSLANALEGPASPLGSAWLSLRNHIMSFPFTCIEYAECLKLIMNPPIMCKIYQCHWLDVGNESSVVSYMDEMFKKHWMRCSRYIGRAGHHIMKVVWFYIVLSFFTGCI